MALENNLDLQVEQIDQSIAEGSVPLAQGGGPAAAYQLHHHGCARRGGRSGRAAAEFFIAGAGTGERGPYLPPPSPPHTTPAGCWRRRTRSSLGTSPYSAGSLVPGFDAQLLGRYGWLRRNPQVSLLTDNPFLRHIRG